MNRRIFRPAGFTLLEMLVVIGIIVVLIGILYPIINRALRGGEVSRLRMDLQTISLALEQYKSDHGDYPRDIDAGLTAAPQSNYRGAILLTKAMIALADEADDGAPGPGFRRRAQGRVFGPYLKPESFRIANPDGSSIDPSSAAYDYAVMMDPYERPILYFPGRASIPDLTQAEMFVNDGPGAGGKPLYDQLDNEILPLAAMREMLGDRETVDGAIGAGETAAHTGPFLLWSAGPDGEFGTEDDVTNFNE